MAGIDELVLALLYEKDLYGYEIEQIIEERQMRNWTRIGFSSIYNSLKNLEKKRMISSRYEKEHGSPKRKVYSLKENQKVYVLEIITNMLASPQREASEFSLGMSFSNYLTNGEVQKALNIYREQLVQRQNHIQKRYTDEPEVQKNLHLQALFTRPLRLIQAEIDWIDEFLGEIKEEKYDY